MACLQDLLPETASESFRAGLHLVGFQMFYHFVINRFAKRREHLFHLLLPIMIIDDELGSRKKPYYREPSMLSLAIRCSTIQGSTTVLDAATTFIQTINLSNLHYLCLCRKVVPKARTSQREGYLLVTAG